MGTENSSNNIRSTDDPNNLDIIKLRREFEEHVTMAADRHEEMLKLNEQTVLICKTSNEECLKSIQELTIATKGVVDGWTVLNGFHRFVKWLSSFAVLGAIGAWVVDKFPTWFS